MAIPPLIYISYCFPCVLPDGSGDLYFPWRTVYLRGYTMWHTVSTIIHQSTDYVSTIVRRTVSVSTQPLTCNHPDNPSTTAFIVIALVLRQIPWLPRNEADQLRRSWREHRTATDERQNRHQIGSSHWILSDIYRVLFQVFTPRLSHLCDLSLFLYVSLFSLWWGDVYFPWCTVYLHNYTI